MSFRGYLTTMAIGTIASFGAWVYVMSSVRPDEATAMDFVLFYLTLSMGLVGILAILGVLYRVLVRRRRDVVSREVKVSFRHAVLLTTVAVLSLLFSKQGSFHWWTPFVLILVASIFEYVSLMVQRSHRG